MISFKTVELEGKVFTDQTGRFPITSSKGSKYAMVLFTKNINAILVEPMKHHSQQETIHMTTKIHEYLTDRDFKPQVQILDNECPDALNKYFCKNNVKFQLVPPHLYHSNLKERAIATFKDHLIAGLASLDPSFPMKL